MSSVALFPLAIEPGFDAGSGWAMVLLFVGLAIVAGIGALSRQHERAFSASVVYLVLGAGAAVAIPLLGGERIDPVADAKIVQRIAELALVVAVFTTGLKVERRLRWSEWRSVAQLILIVMPATIALAALFGTQVMGLSLGAAILLGAILAPTDPVLAGDIGVGPPGEQRDEEARFAISAEAGINDGLASPFVLLGVFIAAQSGTEWLAEWIVADVVYAVAIAILLGALGGHGLAALVSRVRQSDLLHHQFDGFVAVAAPLLLYAVAELVGAYGLVAGFVGGVAFRRYEFSHTYNRTIHDGAEVVEKFFELAVMLLLGSMLTLAGLGEPGLTGWLFIAVLLVLIRPLLVAGVFVRSARLRARGRVFVGWFGVRGVAALFYLTYIVDQEVLAKPEQTTVVWTVLACVAVSVIVHGVTSTPLEGLASGRESRDQAGRSTAVGSPAAVSDSAAP
jgi:NhaP-type Na+/H+ or K+/H+ antiporter